MLKKLLGIFVTSFLFMSNVYAAECTKSDEVKLNEIANNVKIDYDVITEKEEFADMTVDIEKFKITILNVVKEIYVVVENDQGMAKKTYTNADSNNGEISFVWDDTSNITNFTITVYASNDSNCGTLKLTTLHKQTPRYNDYSEMDVCQDEDMKDFYLCQRYVTFDEINSEGFLDKVEGYMNGKIDDKGEEIPDKVTFMDKVIKFLDDYKWFIIGGVAIIGATGGYIYYRRSKKQRELGL